MSTESNIRAKQYSTKEKIEEKKIHQLDAWNK